MFYYTVALLRSSAPVLTYSSDKELTIGDIVLAPLKSSLKRAVVIDEVDIPSFDTAPIFSIEYAQYSSNQMSIAKFMSEYYFSSFSEAISLFLPYNYSPLENNSDVSYWIDKAPKLTEIQSKVYNQIQESSKRYYLESLAREKLRYLSSLCVKYWMRVRAPFFSCLRFHSHHRWKRDSNSTLAPR